MSEPTDDLNAKFHKMVEGIELPDVFNSTHGVTLLLCDGTTMRFTGLSYESVMDRLLEDGYASFADADGTKVTVFGYAVSSVIGEPVA